MDTRQASGLTQARLAGDETIATPYGTVQLEHSYPTDASSALLFDAMDAQRAAQAYLIGPTAPAGMERNWMQTVGQDGWFVYFRLYAPTEPFFDKQFALLDFEAVV